METLLKARGWVAMLVSLLLATASFATPVATDVRKSTEEGTDVVDVTAETAPPPTVSPLDDVHPKAASAATGPAERAQQQRRRNGKSSFDEGLAGKPEGASAARGTAANSQANQDKSAGSVAVVERMMETVRAPVGTIMAGSDEGSAGVSPNPRRRGEVPTSGETNDAPRAVGNGDDAVVKAVKTARELLQEPLAWLLLLLIAGIALAVSHVTRQAR